PDRTCEAASGPLTPRPLPRRGEGRKATPIARTRTRKEATPMQPARLILIEFNELCPHLLRRFMDRSLLPNFRRFHDSSLVCTTDAGESEPNLEPWIQWPTVHSGLPFAEHRVFHLGDGRRLE